MVRKSCNLCCCPLRTGVRAIGYFGVITSAILLLPIVVYNFMVLLLSRQKSSLQDYLDQLEKLHDANKFWPSKDQINAGERIVISLGLLGLVMSYILLRGAKDRDIGLLKFWSIAIAFCQILSVPLSLTLVNHPDFDLHNIIIVVVILDCLLRLLTVYFLLVVYRFIQEIRENPSGLPIHYRNFQQMMKFSSGTIYQMEPTPEHSQPTYDYKVITA